MNLKTEKVSDESDQAGWLGGFYDLHLKNHNGIPDLNCSFCKNFILIGNKEFPFESYKFVLFDVSEITLNK